MTARRRRGRPTARPGRRQTRRTAAATPVPTPAAVHAVGCGCGTCAALDLAPGCTCGSCGHGCSRALWRPCCGACIGSGW